MIPQYEPLINQDIAESVKQQILSGWIGSGKITATFEDEFAKYIGVKYASACTSGTVGLIIALKALGLKPGDHVIVPAYGFIAAINACRFLDLVPYLVDIDLDTLCMNVDKIKNIIETSTPGSKRLINAIIYVDHNGHTNPIALNNLKLFCKKYNVHLIEDAACGLGCWKSVPNMSKYHPGTYGDISIFSFSVPKLITTGQGGMVVTNDYSLNQKIKEIIDQGSTTWRQDQIHHSLGANFKFNDILAAYGLEQLKNISNLICKRNCIHAAYMQHLKERMLYYNLNNENIFSLWMVIYRTKIATKIIDKLALNGVQAKQYYKPVRWSYNPQNMIYENAEKAYFECIYLPSALTLKLEDIQKICKIINEEEKYS